MDRERIAFAAMKPLDLVLGAAVAAAKASPRFDAVSDEVYAVIKSVLRRMFETNNALAAEGLEGVPAEGGVLFASNHQSWSDVQVIGATCPRRLRFLAKTEFETWPILRQLIAISDSPFIRRGGDAAGMAQAVRSLEEGKALVIFPEGTIPGEENVMRHEVEPDTGLLRGHSGMVRLAIAARVPIVPIGVSGTGASFPPEVYPRLELLHLPKKVPITVRYGAPIRFDEYQGRELSHDEIRRLTKQVMRTISSLIEHERNFVPQRVPLEPLPRYERLGVLILHGFTSSLATMEGLVPHVRAAGLPYRLPVLRGHGTTYTDLAGVRAEDWLADAEAALLDLCREVDRVAIVGLSMGGLLALDLAARHPDRVAGLVTLAAALRFSDPLAPLSPLIAKVVRSWPAPDSFNDPELKRLRNQNYPRFMTDAFVSLLQYAREMEQRLSAVRAPICVLHSKKDQIVDPVSANLVYRDVSSPQREIHWFFKSGHEMGQDLEAEEVFRRTMDFVLRLKQGEARPN